MSFIKRFINIDALIDTFKRFPFSSLFVLIVSGIFIAVLYDFLFIKDKNEIGKILFTLILGYFWCGGVALLADEKKYSCVKTSIVSIVGVTALYLIVFEMGKVGVGVRVASVFLSLFAFISYAPFVGRGNSDNDFWVFNKSLWYGVVFSIVAALVFYAGASAALFSIKYLFDVDLGHKIFAFLGIISFSLLAPLYSLSFVPKSTREGDTECTAPKPMAFFINWLLLPLVFFYFLILYAYFIKTGLNGDILKNDVIYMIAGFACVGIAVYLISWPLQQVGGRSAKLYRKIFFPLLIIPTLIMLYAIFDRIIDFGVTEKRYCIALLGLWLLVVMGLRLFGRLRLWYMFASFSTVLFIVSWGPWGMSNISLNSQNNRFETILMETGLLKDNNIVKAQNPRDISFEDRKRISSIYDYLSRHDDKGDDLYGYKNKNDFFDAVGFDYIGRYARRLNNDDVQQEKFNYSMHHANKNVMNVSGYDYYIANLYLFANGKSRVAKSDDVNVDAKLTDNVVTLKIDSDEIPINLLDYLPVHQSSRQKLDNLSIIKSSGRYTVKLTPKYINGVFDGEQRQVKTMSFSLLINQK